MVRDLVHDFVSLARADPNVDLNRGGKSKLDAEGPARFERLLVEWISSMSVGPLKYEGRDMKKKHAGMRITDSQFDAMLGDLVSVLKENSVGQEVIDELMALVGSTRKDIVEEKKGPLSDA